MHGQVNDFGVLRLHGTWDGYHKHWACASKRTHLPYVFDFLFILQKAASPDEPLAHWVRGPGADLRDLMLDITNGRRWEYLDFKGMGIRRELNSHR